MLKHRSRKQKFIIHLAEQIKMNLPADLATCVDAFVQQHYQVSADERLALHPFDSLYAATLSCWEFIQQYDSKAPKVRVLNPDLEQHCWHCNHTVIQILFTDMPPLSIRCGWS